jgi:hypothetical protein|nr:MAG TPA: DNA-directed RNA polymerase subunit alpha [Bacteriophage sp.]
MRRKASYTDRPLTEEERIFAEKRHDLMYRYMRIHELDIDEWYDRLIIPYLQAVKKYHEYKKLQSYKFEQIFFRTLDSARSNYWRDLNRKKRCPEGGVWSLEGLCSNNDYDDLDFYEIVSDKTAYLIDELITAEFDARNLFNELEKMQYKEIIALRLQGYDGKEIRHMMNIPQRKYQKMTREIKDIVMMCME